MDCEQPENDSKEQIEYVSSDDQPESDMPNLELVESRKVMDSITESPEGEVRSSVALSLPGGVENSSVVDTACPAEPEVKDFTPEARRVLHRRLAFWRCQLVTLLPHSPGSGGQRFLIFQVLHPRSAA